jgi:hypothetical protein
MSINIFGENKNLLKNTFGKFAKNGLSRNCFSFSKLGFSLILINFTLLCEYYSM